MQPHFNAGVSISGVLNELFNHRTCQELLKESAEMTGRSYKDPFLFEIEKEMWERLNIRPEGVATEESTTD